MAKVLFRRRIADLLRSGFLALADMALDSPRTSLLVLTAATAVMAAGFGALELRTDGAAIYPLDNLTVRRSEKDLVTFGEPQRVVLLVTSRPGGPAVESPAGFRYLKSLHTAIEALAVVPAGRVRSLADLLKPPAGPDSPYVHSYLEELDSSPRGFAGLVSELREHPLTDGLFLSPDGRAAAVYVPLVEGGDRLEHLAVLQRFLRAESGPFELRLTGPATAEARLGQAVLRDLAWLTPFMVAVVVLLLFFSLGTVGGVAAAMLEVLVVLVSTLGAMGWCGVPVTLVTTIVPVVLMAMAVTDEIHLLERFQASLGQARRRGAGGRPAVREAMRSSLRELHRPIVLTSLTTALAFLSFLPASMAPLRHFGMFTCLGILLAMVLSFTLIPALAVLMPESWFEPRRLRRRAAGPAPPAFLERFVARASGRAALLALGLVLLGLPGLARLTVQDSWVDNFDPRSEVVSAERDFNAGFWGSYAFDVVLEAAEEGFFHRPEGIALVEELSRRARLHPDVGGVVTYLVPFQIIAEAWREGGPISELPQASFRRIAAWVNLIGHRIDLHEYVTGDARSARVRILVNRPDYLKGEALSKYVTRVLRALPRPPGLQHHYSGHLPLAVEVVRAIVANQLRSIVWTFVGVGLLVAVALRSLTRAIVVVLPVSAATALVMSAMGYAGWPLGIATSMFAAMTLGVGVDFALHFSHRYDAERRRGAGHSQALAATFASTGRAMRWNTRILAAGFLILSFSALKPNHSLGLLLAVALLASYGTSLFFLPWPLAKLHTFRSGEIEGRPDLLSPFFLRRPHSLPPLRARH